MESDIDNVKSFLSFIEEKIDPENPLSYEEILKLSQKDGLYKMDPLNENILKQEYNDEFFNKIKEKRSKFPGFPEKISFDNIGIQIDGKQYDTYRDEITKVEAEIKYLKYISYEKKRQLKSYKNSVINVKILFCLLIIFSFAGVFLPLYILSLTPIVMNYYKFHILMCVIICWIFILIYFFIEIIKIGKKI